jgi:sugar lactone lactonase YvrE
MTLTLLARGGAFFESPRWHDGAWWVSDFYRRGVYRIDTAGTASRWMTVEGQPSGLGWMPDGSMLAVSMLDRQIVRRWPDGRVSMHADLSGAARGVLNDMVVDASGRAYVGSFGYDPGTESPAPARLILVDPDGSHREQSADLAVPNGAVITPGGQLIVGESMGSRYTEFDIGPTGELGQRRLWAQLSPGASEGFVSRTPGSFVPDGCALDAAGDLWSADPIGRRCCLITRGGAVRQTIPAPDEGTMIACALGGQDGRTLLLCVAPMSAHQDHERRDAVLMTMRVTVPGV